MDIPEKCGEDLSKKKYHCSYWQVKTSAVNKIVKKQEQYVSSLLQWYLFLENDRENFSLFYSNLSSRREGQLKQKGSHCSMIPTNMFNVTKATNSKPVQALNLSAW